jgi:hypothetical protein
MDKKLFFGANTAEGFVGYYDQIVDMYDLKKLYILKGGSGVGKSTFIKKFADHLAGHDRDFLVCSGDPSSLDGVIIPDKKIGIIDGTAPHAVDPKYPGIADEIINLGEYIIAEKVKAGKKEIAELSDKKKEYYKKATEMLRLARETHYRLEGFYKGAVDFNKIDKRLESLITELETKD